MTVPIIPINIKVIGIINKDLNTNILAIPIGTLYFNVFSNPLYILSFNKYN